MCVMKEKFPQFMSLRNAQQSYLQAETFDFSGTVRLFAQNESNFIPHSFSACFRRHPCSATESEMKKKNNNNSNRLMRNHNKKGNPFFMLHDASASL